LFFVASTVVSLTCAFGKTVDSRWSTVDRKTKRTRVRRNESLMRSQKYGS